MQQQGEIVIYQPQNIDNFQLEVRVDDESVWLNRNQLALLFGRDVKTIGKHINNSLKEELRNIQVVAKFATTVADGKTYQVENYGSKLLLHDDLEYIIFVIKITKHKTKDYGREKQIKNSNTQANNS